MATNYNPRTVTDGLVLALDGGNIKSFKGTPATNLLYSLINVNGEVNTTDFKCSYGNETAFIPALGYKTVRYCNIYNNYPTSGNCCPTLFQYGGNVLSQNITVSPSTTYTYEIIYKTTSGYTHPNFMYRYEYNSGTYVTESGVHIEANRTSLGDGWYHAWGQFTTQATTNNLWMTGMWYYQYAVYDKVSVAAVSLHQGTYIIPPEHMLTAQENRGATVATGGGWADLSGSSNNGELVNGPSYSSGSITFDGTDDQVWNGVGNNYPYPYHTLDVWVKSSSLSPTMNGGGGLIAFDYGRILMINSVGGIYYVVSDGSNTLVYSNINENLIFNNTWHNVVALRGPSAYQVYVDGVLKDSGSNGGNPGWNGLNVWSAMSSRIGDNPNDNRYKLLGNIAAVKVYNRALSAAEVSQNFNALRSRFSI
jgi:hypothetical protein